MAQKISELTSTTSLDGTETLPLIQSGSTKKITQDKVSGVHYATTEQLTGGTWINGKPIYRKVISAGTLPNATSISMPHGISNYEMLVNTWGVSKNTGGFTITLNQATGSGWFVDYYLRDNDLFIRSATDASTYTETYIVLEYTKTTD